VTARYGYQGTNFTDNEGAATGVIVASGTYTTDTSNLQTISCEAYLGTFGGSGSRSQAVRMAMFADNGSGVPVANAAVTSNELVVTDATPTGGYVQFTVPTVVLAASTAYFVAFWWGTQTNSGQFNIWDSDGTASKFQYFDAAFTYASTGNATGVSWSTASSPREYRNDFLAGPVSTTSSGMFILF